LDRFKEEAGMSKKRYRSEEITSRLREADVLIRQGRKVVDVIKALGITDVTYYRWRQEYGGMSVSQAKRLKELEKENERLRKAVSDLTLDKMILKEAAILIEQWRRHYNGVRPHSALGYRPPAPETIAFPALGLTSPCSSLETPIGGLH
jgi:transposase InsO family protein